MQGHTDVASRFVKPLAKKWLKDNDWAAFDGMIYLFQPILLVAMLISTTMSIVQLFYPTVQFWFTPNLAIPAAAWNVIMLVQLAFFPFILWLEKKLTFKMLLYYIPYIAFTYTWMPIAAVGMAKKNQKEWFHTQHTRKISIDELES